jgi:transcriptional regulator with PAS, ATPase and Fis domain
VDYLKEVVAKAGLARTSAPAIAPPDMTVPEDISVNEDPEEQDFEEMVPEDLSIRTANMDLIEKVLRKHGGNRKAAAAELGISERTLYRKIKNIK